MSIWNNLEWTYTGVNHSLPGNGGIDCVNFIPYWQKIIETSFVTMLGSCEMFYAYTHMTLPKHIPPLTKPDSAAKRLMLVLMCIVFGIELGFKFATKQMLWILNPCHLITMSQIWLLAAPQNKISMAIFRLQMHGLSGATIAMFFPVINTRLLPFETEVYYIQHGLMLLIPFYLMRTGGIYVPEATSDFSWAFATKSFLYLFHWLVMQPLAILSHVNLNNLMCPAVSDPFYGRGYRMCAVVHQTAVVLLHGKLYTIVAKKLLPLAAWQVNIDAHNGLHKDEKNEKNS